MIQLCALLIALVVLFSNDVEGCARTIRNPSGGGVVVVNPNNPPNAPPTPSPTPPPPPPAVPDGWVPPPPSSGMLAQEMSRTNCYKKVIFDVDADGSESAGATQADIVEIWQYTCDFRVCSQVQMTGESGECACALFAGNTGGNTYNGQENLKYTTQVKYFMMVVWNTITRRIIEEIPGWDFGGATNEQIATDLAARAGSEGNMDYASGLQAFSGSVNTAELPASLSNSTLANQGNVAAACFVVLQTYETKTKWAPTPEPKMYSDPSLWSTECVPVYDNDLNNVVSGSPSGEASKRSALEQRFWVRKFFLFAMSDSSASSSAHIAAGAAHRHRYIEAYYTNSACNIQAGKFSIDSRFEQVVAREKHYDLVGAWDWTRTYTERFFVGGVPRAFSQPAQFWSTGYHQVNWLETFSKVNGVGAFRPGVMWASLMGDCSVDYTGCQDDIKYKICTKLPESWKTASPVQAGMGENTAIQVQPKVYGETAVFYPIIEGEVECQGFVNHACKVEHTFFSFQNFGGDQARNYAKLPTSWLVVGPKTHDCTYPQIPDFDRIPFKAHQAGSQLRKRSSLQDDAADKVIYNGNGIPGLKNNDENSAFDTPVGAGGLNSELGFRIALGSVDQNGAPMGDHPLELFPEQYAAPVSLDPNDPTQKNNGVSLALAWDGKAPPCLLGTQGCACRPQTGQAASRRPPCDQPLACQNIGGDNFCVIPECPIGTAGCGCLAGGKCSESHLSCEAEQCIFNELCTPGTAGCTADTSDGAGAAKCNDGSFIEFQGDQIVCAYKNCVKHAAGCECDAEKVNNGETTCGGGRCIKGMCRGFISDDEPIPAGKFGGHCDGTTECELGFQCVEETCVPNTCTPGQNGCICTPSLTCDEEGVTCGDDGRCMRKSCTPGSRGCGCNLGICAEGYTCDYNIKKEGRCIEEACNPGDAGCPCNEDKSCNGKSFKCIALKKDGSDERCMSTGIDCETPRADLCVTFCGAGNVASCPACSGALPTCIKDPREIFMAGEMDTGSSSSATLYAASALIAAVMVALF